MHVDNSACNLVSLNLMKFRRAVEVLALVWPGQESAISGETVPSGPLDNVQIKPSLGLFRPCDGRYSVLNKHPTREGALTRKEVSDVETPDVPHTTDLDPRRGWRVNANLADYAVVTPDGKLTSVGAGWTMTGPQASPFAIAMLIGVPWHETNTRHTVRVELFGDDGPVTPIEDDEPKWIQMEFEVGRPVGVRPGSQILVPAALNHGPMPLEAGRHYEWRISVNGMTHEDWQLAFSTRPEAQSNAA